MKTLEKFFNEYAEASMTGDANHVAKQYDESFIVVSKDKSSAFSNDSNFIKWLEGVFKFNQDTGLQEMTVKKIETTSVGKYFYKSTVTWAAVYAANSAKSIKFEIHYILRQTESSYKIVLYISEEDQEELLKENGLL